MGGGGGEGFNSLNSGKRQNNRRSGEFVTESIRMGYRDEIQERKETWKIEASTFK